MRSEQEIEDMNTEQTGYAASHTIGSYAEKVGFTTSQTRIDCLPTGRTVVRVTSDGEVFIDWSAIESSLRDPNCEPTAKAMAAMAKAVRDGTWKPLGAG